MQENSKGPSFTTIWIHRKRAIFSYIDNQNLRHKIEDLTNCNEIVCVTRFIQLVSRRAIVAPRHAFIAPGAFTICPCSSFIAGAWIYKRSGKITMIRNIPKDDNTSRHKIEHLADCYIVICSAAFIHLINI